MPYVVLEAIAAGLPIVATNVGGIPEIFGPRAGELVPAGDPAALTTALRRIFADPQRAVDDAAARRAFILPRFNVNAMARDTLALYRDIVAAPAAAPRAIGA
jgi:glycosyltransferase involved in cell wall biosynthesis